MSVAQAYAILEHSSVVELPAYIRRVPGSIPGVPIFQNGGMAMISEFVEYVKQVWKNKPNVSSPLNADRLNHMEDGIENNSKKIKETVTAVNELTEKMYVSYDSVGIIVNESSDATEKKITISQDGFVQAMCKTGADRGQPFIRLQINKLAVFEGQAENATYRYLWTPLFPVKAGDVVIYTITNETSSGERTIRLYGYR